MVSDTLHSATSGTRAIARRVASPLPWERLSLLGVLALAAFLNLFRLGLQGEGNTYYTAAVKSMITGWHAWFFASFDAAGFVTVDKPPLGLWIQTVSAKLLGVSGFSVILPQVIAGVLSVALLYHLVRRTWGAVAGLLAALALALSPISVVTNRTNNLDSLLVLVVLLAAWAVIRATETGRLRWLLLGVTLVGLGFNIKMMQAYLVLPAFYALYFLAARTGWWRRIGHLAVATVVLVAVSLSWAVVVDLTPASARPYIGSSDSNSAIDLILGYNGLDRLLGRGGPGGARPGSAPPAQMPAGFDPAQGGANGAVAPPPDAIGDGDQRAPRSDGGGGPGGGGETGERGPLRLLNQQMAGQIGWLLPFAVVGFAGALWYVRPRLPLDNRAQSLLLWGVWFLTAATFFSVAGFFHRYYLVMLAPAVAALCGIGAAALWRLYRRGGLGGWLLPVALLVTAAVQVQILADYPDWQRRLVPLVLGLSGVLALALVAGRLLPRLRVLRTPALALALGVPALLAAPAVWAGVSVWNGTNTTLPAAGPAEGGFGMPNRAGMPGDGGPGGSSADKALVQYLQENRGDATYLVATQSAMAAAPIILETGEAVMAMGGFSGGDPILTADDIAQLVREGTVRFFLAGGGPGMRLAVPSGETEQTSGDGAVRDGGAGQPSQPASEGPVIFGGPMGDSGGAMNWVTQNCTVVPTDEIGGASEQLYDCAVMQEGA
jgi:4-amino-4-deoxy-L-arabinose transferase-like glycosyltransferase